MNHVVVVDIEFSARPSSGWRSRLARMTIDGVAIEAARLASINSLLDTFETVPEFAPHCLPNRFRLALHEVGRTRVTRSEYVDVSPSR